MDKGRLISEEVRVIADRENAATMLSTSAIVHAAIERFSNNDPDGWGPGVESNRADTE